MDASPDTRKCARVNPMIPLWLLLIVGVVVVVILGTILQRLGRMVGGCLCIALVVIGVVIGAYMLFTGAAFCDVPLIGESVC
jgi:CHASE2 domain-containing sensor protein